MTSSGSDDPDRGRAGGSDRDRAGGPADGSAGDPAVDAHRLADAEHVVHGPDGAGAVRTVLYAAYVTALIGLTYGFTVARGVFVTSDPQWVRTAFLSPAAAAAFLVALCALVAVSFRAGRVRGAVVPPLPWIDQVVASALDRRLVLRSWWGISASLLVVGGTVVGGIVGGGLWASASTGPMALVVGLVGGALACLLLALAWLAGEVSAGRPPRRSGLKSRFALREIRIETLREQAVRSTHLGGAVLAGDLRAARLEVAAPVRHARTARLRAAGPVRTMVRRDVLGLRRQPGSLLVGLLLAAPAAAVLGWALSTPAVPPAAAVIAAVAAYFGVGQWAEGLRLGADTSGCPVLFGLTPRAEALAHSVVPTVLAVVTCVAAGSAAVVAAGGVWSVGIAAWLAGCAVVLVELQWLTAFRGTPPTSAFVPESGPTSLVMFLGRSVLLSALVVGGVTAVASHWGVSAVWSFFALAIVIGASWAGGRQAALTGAHRS